MVNLKDKLVTVEETEKCLLRAKAAYIQETMLAMIESEPISQLADDCRDFIESTYKMARSFNHDN